MYTENLLVHPPFQLVGRKLHKCQIKTTDKVSIETAVVSQGSGNSCLHNNIQWRQPPPSQQQSTTMITTLTCTLTVNGWKGRVRMKDLDTIPHGWTTNYDWSTTGKIRNRSVKMENGNGNKDKMSVRIIHWNLGSRQWQRKTEDILCLAQELKPDLLFISEANLLEAVPTHETIIEGYTIEKPKTCKNRDLMYSRLVLLVKQGVQYEILKQEMEDDLSHYLGQTGKKRQEKGNSRGMLQGANSTQLWSEA